ncbi:antitoxin Xre-like helix-turn-helix domain-containing protein [Spirosoma arcticum]
MQSALPTQPTRLEASRPVTDLIRQARQGVLRRRADEVAQLVDLTDKEMARILNMSVRGLHGKSATEPLTLAAGERLLLLERLIQHGLSVFDGRSDLLGRWLRTPLTELAYREGANPVAQPLSVRDLGQFGDFTEPAPKPVQPVKTPAPLAPSLVPQSPLAVLDTVSGFSLAEDVLGRIEWGITG